MKVTYAGVIEKWERSGLLDGLEIKTKRNLAGELEKAVRYFLKTNDHKTANIIIPTIAKIMRYVAVSEIDLSMLINLYNPKVLETVPSHFYSIDAEAEYIDDLSKEYIAIIRGEKNGIS